MTGSRRIPVPERDRADDLLTNSDYAAAWRVAVAETSSRSAEEWARAIFEAAPPALRRFIVVAWTIGLGLRLGPRPSPDHVLGWTIVSRSSDAVTLRVHSVVLGGAHFTLRVEESHLVLASFVHYEKPWAGAVWWLVKPLHHRIVPYLLAHASSEYSSQTS